MKESIVIIITLFEIYVAVVILVIPSTRLRSTLHSLYCIDTLFTGYKQFMIHVKHNIDRLLFREMLLYISRNNYMIYRFVDMSRIRS